MNWNDEWPRAFVPGRKSFAGPESLAGGREVGEEVPFLHVIKSVPRSKRRHCYIHQKPSCSCFVLASVLTLQMVSCSDCRPTNLLSVGSVEHYGNPQRAVSRGDPLSRPKTCPLLCAVSPAVLQPPSDKQLVGRSRPPPCCLSHGQHPPCVAAELSH